MFDVLAPIALGSTARVDLCRSRGPVLPDAPLAHPGAAPGQLVAVKRPLSELMGDENIGKRFLDEVWMTAALRHPHVVGVVGWGRDGVGPYLAVELVQGVSLARLMKSVFETGEQFTERLVVYVGSCVARGLAAAHELRSDRGELLQLVHRDLSAGNVLCGFQGEVKIADFGLAKAKDRLTVTTSELPTRTIGHVSPEELGQGAVDHRSDIFSFGVMLFELLTGRPPFAGKDDLHTIEAILKKPAPDPLKLRPKMDRALAAVVAACLEKDPARRPSSARDVGAELDRWLDVHGYRFDNQDVLARFVRRNSMRQMRWFERIITGGPEPAPSPVKVPLPSLYDVAGDRAPASPAAATGTATSRRADEPTMVDRPRTKAVTGRRRSADNLVSLAKTRKIIDSSPGEGEVPLFMEGETEEDVPTVAMKVDQATRDAIKAGAFEGPRLPRGPLGTAYLDEAGGEPAPAPSRSLGQRIERELERMRTLATRRHEHARAAREAARVAVLEAERAEAEARVVERAIASARQALDAAARGQSAEAERRLEEALDVLAQAARR